MHDPVCVTPGCDAPNHCPVCHIHHPVDSMVRWCIDTKG